MVRTKLAINGMSCGHCVRAVDRALRGLPGVQVEEVTVGAAIVDYDPERAGPERIEQAVEEAGYTVRNAESAS